MATRKCGNNLFFEIFDLQNEWEENTHTHIIYFTPKL